MNTQTITPDTPMSQVTVGQFVQYLTAHLIDDPKPQVKYVKAYTLGCMLGVTGPTVKKYLHTFMKDAIVQFTRPGGYVIDLDKALELYKAYKRPWEK